MSQSPKDETPPAAKSESPEPESPESEPESPESGPASLPESGPESRPAQVDSAAGYRVLARKYRPQNFAELIGQDAMVRTLTNALASGRLAHAFILTGVRGVGKTTTARIIARALNCIGPNGSGSGSGAGPTAEPCGVCEVCLAIAEDRHIDVIEMDAASRTGVDDIRDLIDGVRYRPASARYKVYIIDEVHMLSRQAFDALLKTLEEPPEHVKFVFATTEIRKVPVTVLSRCQRFDLRRLEPAVLGAHLASVAAREGAAVEEAALRMIVRAADGSVRDGLSLLDQAIALGGGGVAGAAGTGSTAATVTATVGAAAAVTATVTASEVGDMLGLADRGHTLDLFDSVMKGEIAEVLTLVAKLYAAGADPLMVIQDLLDLTHWLTRLKLVEGAAEGVAVSEAERERAAAMAEALSMPILARTWQMLLKGLGEAQLAPAPRTALEMLLVRLAYAAELPAPAEIVKSLGAGAGANAGAPAAAAPAPAPAPATPPAEAAPPPSSTGPAGGARAALAVEPQPESETEPPQPGPPQPAAPPSASLAPMPGSFAEAVALFAERREVLLNAHLVNHAHLVRFEPGRIELRPAEGAPKDLANSLGRRLTEWTGERWVVTVSGEPGEPTLGTQAVEAERAEKEAAAADPLVRAVLDTFPGATIEAVRPRDGRQERAAPAAADAEDEEQP